MPDAPIPPLAQVLVLAACVGLGLALLLWGPTRAVKIGVAVLVVALALGVAVHSGDVAALGFLPLILGINAVAMGTAVLLHAMPLQKNLAPVNFATCPRHGQAKLQRWTRELAELGFAHQGDFQSEWQFAGQRRRSFIRFLLHHSKTTWAELHVLDEPKMAARLVASRAEGNTYLATVDRQANEEFFRDPQTRVLRVASSSKCSEMVRRHEDRVAEASGSRLPVEDVASVHAEIYDSWIRRLLQSGQLVARGTSAKIPLRIVPSTVLRTMSAWFH